MIGELLSVGIKANQSRLLSDVRSGSIATEMSRLRDVRFAPESDRTADIA
jgi:hypothetical protein